MMKPWPCWPKPVMAPCATRSPSWTRPLRVAAPTLSGELVRGLVGNVGSEVLEDLMGTVARSSSEEALRMLDRLMTEGHNPAHFARQLVRFLRNAVVAKVAGDDSALLQISSDERARVGRVAQPVF